VFGAPVRWTLVVLAWIAFSVAGYLAFHSVTGTAVAGCTLGSGHGCDVVLSSSWSKWIGVPIAVLGLAVYATLASLALFLGRGGEAANRWITTIFVMLAVVAAGASAWFIGVQVFALRTYCRYCLVADTSGIVLGILALGAAVQRIIAQRNSSRFGGLQPGLMALRPVGAGVPRTASAAAVAMPASPPSLLMAFGGALPLLAILIGGQLLFAAKTYRVEKVALTDSIDMNGRNTKDTQSGSATQRIAMRPTSSDDDHSGIEDEKSVGDTTKLASSDAKASDPHPPSEASGKTTDATAPDPGKTRLVKFLGGKLVLDIYKHPIIGSPEAPHIIIEMVSYDCPHCRKMNSMIHEALDHYGDQVALLVMPIPLDKDCNKLITDPAVTHPGACGTARMVIGLAKLDPKSFARFHDFLMSGDNDKPPRMEKIIPKAYGMVPADKLRELQRGPEVAKQLESYVDLFGQLQAKSKDQKAFGLPVQILGDNVVSGEVEKIDDVYKAWEENLHIEPK
jgi:uncharacterized membrane protein/thiol-disulfide isomerase/thioredoxin